MKYLDVVVGCGSTFGVLFMTNIGGSGKDAANLELLGVGMVCATLIIMWKTLKRQAVEIERLKGILGAPTNAAADKQ